MFLGNGVAIDVSARDDVTQNSCLEGIQTQRLWWQKSTLYLMFLGRGVAIDVAASDDVTQNSCLERIHGGTNQLFT